MDNDTSPKPSGSVAHQSWWQKLHAKFILWGILPPPGASEAGLSEEEQAVQRRITFRRHPGGGKVL